MNTTRRSSNDPHPCPDCHTEVQWTTTNAGKRYLANVGAYGHGTRRFRGPHTPDRCEAAKVRLDAAIADREAREAREAANVRGVNLFARWVAVYGDDLRAWAATDSTAAGDHMLRQQSRALGA